MNAFPVALAVVSFAVPAAAYGIVSGLLLISIRRSAPSRWLLAATLGTCLWGAISLTAIAMTGLPANTFPALDGVHLALWACFVGAMVKHSVSSHARPYGQLLMGAAILLCLGVIANLALPIAASVPVRFPFVLVLSIALLGLLGLEQVFRNSTSQQRPFLKLLTIAIGWIFVVNIYVYSEALLFESASVLSWSLRGLGIAAVAPLVVLAVKRYPNWGEDLYVSRHVVFYTTTLTAVGIYLIAVAAGGYLIGTLGFSWGPVLQAGFLLLSGTILAYLLFSRTLRARLRVFLAKHFYRNRYDYREEWLRLMKTLVGQGHESGARERGIRALAGIIGSRSGELWLQSRDSGRIVHRGGWKRGSVAGDRRLPEQVIEYLQRTRWVIDTEEYRLDPESYSNAFAGIPSFSDEPAILVPLVHGDTLVGVVWLERPDGLGSLAFEDHDLLKTAGQQVAIFLIQERDQEELSQTKQFQAFSRVTAFMMHDLKNLISQQELVVGNAKRYRDRPEFVDDAFRTMDVSVQRMRALLERLRSTTPLEQTNRVDVSKLAHDVVSSCSDREPKPRLTEVEAARAWVLIDRDKLGMALTHAIRNAQDATNATGDIVLSLSVADSKVVIEVTDDGVGMEAAFVNDKLFRPFESTKGASGMGIGAYQIMTTLRGAGGDVSVESVPGRGTTIRMVLPLDADTPVAADASSA